MKKFICKNCGEDYYEFKNRRKQFCSRKCFKGYSSKVNYKCEICNEDFKDYPNRKRKFCSVICKSKWMENHIPWNKGKKGLYIPTIETKIKMRESHIAEKSSSWKGGIISNGQGYIKVYKPNHPFAVNNYVLEHRLVIEKKLGRYLKPEEIPHHIDFDTSNNHPDNLFLFPNRGPHNDYHGMLRHLVRLMMEVI